MRGRTLAGGLAALLGMLSSPAWAQEPEPSQKDQIAALEAELQAQHAAGLAHDKGEPGGDPDGYTNCAATALTLYNQYADQHPDPDRLLWIGGDCSMAAAQFGQGIQAWTALLERYPDSEHAQTTLRALAESYEAVAKYKDSAQRYEQFAARYPKHMDTPNSLRNAYLFRVGLGQPEQALRDLGEFERLYQKKDPEQAAASFWSRASLLDGWKDQRQHAEDYLQQYARAGGLDRRIVAESVIAQIDWRRSCPKPLLLDSCITVERRRTHPSAVLAQSKLADKPTPTPAPASKPKRYQPPKRCNLPARTIITVHRRKAKLAADAQARFTKVLELVYRGKIEIPEEERARVEAFNTAWAMALVFTADADFEEYLAVELPTNLDFFIPARDEENAAAWAEYKAQLKIAEGSQRQMGEYFERKMKLGQELQARYFEVKVAGSPAGLLMAAGRMAMVLQSFADQLRHAPVPRKLRTEPEVLAFCDALADYAAPVAEQANAALTYCVDRSTQYQYFNASSRDCEAELAELDPRRYPPLAELFGEPAAASTRVVSVGVLSKADAQRFGLAVE